MSIWWYSKAALRIAALFSSGLLLLCSASFAADSTWQTVPLNGQHDAVLLVPHAQVLEDPARAFDLPKVRAMDSAWNALPKNAPALKFGISSSAWWVRVRLANASAQEFSYVVSLNSSRQDHVRWMVLDGSGRLIVDNITGDRLAHDTRLVPYHGMALPLTLKAGERAEVYIRLTSHDGLFEPAMLSVSSEEPFFRALHRRNIGLSLYFGALIALGLYNLFIFVSTRTREFAAYVAYLASLLAWNVCYLGVGFELFWPNQPQLNHQLILVTGGFSYATLAWFSVIYLRLQEAASFRRAVLLYRLSIALNALSVVAALTDRITLAILVQLIVGLPILVGTLSLCIHLLRCGQREARFLAGAIGILVVSLTLFYCRLFGALPDNQITAHSVQIGSFLEMLLLAFGLADSMNTLKAQKLAAEQQAHEAQKALASDLEHQVKDRTRALEKANKLLGEMAITDELTGAFNRRHFNQYCAEALDRQSRGEPLALCMFDIDHFKLYNDHYGHQAGDAVLRDVTRIVNTALKRSDDHLFRLGGEEFGVLFGASTPDKAREFVEALREAIVSLQRPHAKSLTIDVLTASFGIVWWPAEAAAHPTPDVMYAAADAALYEAKNSGRNCVVLSAFTEPPSRHAAKPAHTPQWTDAHTHPAPL